MQHFFCAAFVAFAAFSTPSFAQPPSIADGTYAVVNYPKYTIAIYQQRITKHFMKITVGGRDNPVIYPQALRLNQAGEYETAGYYSYKGCEWPVYLTIMTDPADKDRIDVTEEFASGLQEGCRYSRMLASRFSAKMLANIVQEESDL